jgi:hypothetical protein
VSPTGVLPELRPTCHALGGVALGDGRYCKTGISAEASAADVQDESLEQVGLVSAGWRNALEMYERRCAHSAVSASSSSCERAVRLETRPTVIVDRYGYAIVLVATNEQIDGRRLVDLESMRDLLRLAENHGALVLHEPPPAECFWFELGGTTFRYEPVAPFEAPLREPGDRTATSRPSFAARAQ